MGSRTEARQFLLIVILLLVAVLGWVTYMVLSWRTASVERVVWSVLWLCVAPCFWTAAYYAGKQARVRRVAPMRKPLCPRCGYNLTGLSEARCPECGARFTMDQLWSAWVRAYVGVESEDEL